MVYRGNHLSDLREIVNQSVRDLKAHIDEFDAIVVRGISGLAVGSPVSLRLKKDLLVVRKPQNVERSHGSFPVIGARVEGARILFFDDFRAGGVTFMACRDALLSEGKPCSIVGQYLYDRGGYTKFQTAFTTSSIEARKESIIAKSKPPAIPAQNFDDVFNDRIREF